MVLMGVLSIQLMKHKDNMYSLETINCGCHPETCCCWNYRIIKTTPKMIVIDVAQGDDYGMLLDLVNKANATIQKEQK